MNISVLRYSGLSQVFRCLQVRWFRSPRGLCIFFPLTSWPMFLSLLPFRSPKHTGNHTSEYARTETNGKGELVLFTGNWSAGKMDTGHICKWPKRSTAEGTDRQYRLCRVESERKRKAGHGAAGDSIIRRFHKVWRGRGSYVTRDGREHGRGREKISARSSFLLVWPFGGRNFEGDKCASWGGNWGYHVVICQPSNWISFRILRNGNECLREAGLRNRGEALDERSAGFNFTLSSNHCRHGEWASAERRPVTALTQSARAQSARAPKLGSARAPRRPPLTKDHRMRGWRIRVTSRCSPLCSTSSSREPRPTCALPGGTLQTHRIPQRRCGLECKGPRSNTADRRPSLTLRRGGRTA